jgi:hypothetical protein
MEKEVSLAIKGKTQELKKDLLDRDRQLNKKSRRKKK